MLYRRRLKKLVLGVLLYHNTFFFLAAPRAALIFVVAERRPILLPKCRQGVTLKLRLFFFNITYLRMPKEKEEVPVFFL